MLDLIKPILDRIYIESQLDSSDKSLMSGVYGRALFQYYYALHFESVSVDSITDIQLLAERAYLNNSLTFCNGRAGIDWFFGFLYKRVLLDKEDWLFLCADRELQRKHAIEMCENGNFDFLHGSCGIAHSLIYNSHSDSNAFIKQFFYHLCKSIDSGLMSSSLPYYDHAMKSIDTNKTNLGLAHGIASILKFCLECFKEKICVNEASDIANRVINFFLNSTNSNKEVSYYSYFIEKGEQETKPSRLAWCYGDLGIGYILYQAGIAFQSKQLTDYALQVLLHSSERKNFDDTRVMDAGLCHGSAGIAHIYNKLSKYYHLPIFDEAATFWIDQTLIQFDSIGEKATYKRYNPVTDAYEDDNGLLEGSAGIGLALISYLNNDFDWDYCLMLNT